LANTLTSTIDPNLVLNSQTAQAIAVIGDRWAFLIIRDVFQGINQFEPLLKRSGAARGTLTSRLKSLVQSGILYKNPYQTSPTRYEYRLTEKGLNLGAVVLNSWIWETRWAKDDSIPRVLFHKTCGHSIHPNVLCKQCDKVIHLSDTSYAIASDTANIERTTPRSQRRSKNPDISGEGVNQEYFHVLDILGDRWTALVVAAALFGMKRYDDIVSAIGISTNILADRLKLLVNVGVLIRRPYQERPVRFDYHLSEKGRDLFNIALAMHEWANRWLIKDSSEPLQLKHSLCSGRLESKIVCDQCGDVLEWNQITPKDPSLSH
jgi:DNA-binding HxlR family transcriptional regulator